MIQTQGSWVWKRVSHQTVESFPIGQLEDWRWAITAQSTHEDSCKKGKLPVDKSWGQHLPPMWLDVTKMLDGSTYPRWKMTHFWANKIILISIKDDRLSSWISDAIYSWRSLIRMSKTVCRWGLFRCCETAKSCCHFSPLKRESAQVMSKFFSILRRESKSEKNRFWDFFRFRTGIDQTSAQSGPLGEKPTPPTPPTPPPLPPPLL